MKRHILVLQVGFVALVVLGTISNGVLGAAQSLTQSEKETVRAVRKMLERLPYYGVFDYIVFRVNKGTIGLAGYAFEGGLKKDAEHATKRVTGVEEVVNKIEVLPASLEDDRIRWETFYKIYTDDFLSRYAPGGVYGVLREIADERHFPGMQPAGVYAIHIIVKNGRTMLLGVVDSSLDSSLAEVRAREVTGVFNVENGLIVAGREQEGATK